MKIRIGLILFDFEESDNKFSFFPNNVAKMGVFFFLSFSRSANNKSKNIFSTNKRKKKVISVTGLGKPPLSEMASERTRNKLSKSTKREKNPSKCDLKTFPRIPPHKDLALSLECHFWFALMLEDVKIHKKNI